LLQRGGRYAALCHAMEGRSQSSHVEEPR
jgi:hypothetical protein